MKETILTGIRTNSDLHIGHTLGVLTSMTRLANKFSDKHHINIFVPDLHSIISEIDGDMQTNIIRSIKYYIASGLKVNDNIHIYRQSHVPAHSELTWILNCFTYFGEASRMIQFKEKSEGKGENVNLGILDYPVLMAADIILYSAKYVPVGEDQFQHIELTRDIATRFNNRFGYEVFTLPVTTKEQAKFMGVEEGIRIRDLINPEKKMSKSTVAANSKIMVSDTPDEAAKKIMSATTDSLAHIDFDMFNQPGISNLLQILALITDEPLDVVTAEWAGQSNYGDLKRAVAEAVREYLTDFQAKYSAISDQQAIDLFETGEKYANEVANAKLLEVQKLVGLR